MRYGQRRDCPHHCHYRPLPPRFQPCHHHQYQNLHHPHLLLCHLLSYLLFPSHPSVTSPTASFTSAVPVTTFLLQSSWLTLNLGPGQEAGLRTTPPMLDRPLPPFLPSLAPPPLWISQRRPSAHQVSEQSLLLTLPQDASDRRRLSPPCQPRLYLKRQLLSG